MTDSACFALQPPPPGSIPGELERVDFVWLTGIRVTDSTAVGAVLNRLDRACRRDGAFALATGGFYVHPDDLGGDADANAAAADVRPDGSRGVVDGTLPHGFFAPVLGSLRDDCRPKLMREAHNTWFEIHGILGALALFAHHGAPAAIVPDGVCASHRLPESLTSAVATIRDATDNPDTGGDDRILRRRRRAIRVLLDSAPYPVTRRTIIDTNGPRVPA